MSEIELLELAAKAAGISGPYAENGYRKTFGIRTDCRIVNAELWNPLTDDGDALRLAVKLEIGVTHYPIFAKPKHSVIAKQYQSHLDLDRGLSTAIEVIELYKDDNFAATRRAITRAAAEIGKAMK